VRSALAALVSLTLLSSTAHAQFECEARLTRARAVLERDARNWSTWAWAWGIGYSAASLGSAGLALYLDDEKKSASMWVGAGKSALGLVPIFLKPSPAPGLAAELRNAEFLSPSLRDPNPDRCALAAQAEQAVVASAKDQAFARSWVAHAGPILVNGGGLLIVGLAYDDWLMGSLAAAVGLAVGEANIWTRPSASLHAQRDWALVPTASSGGVGLSVVGSF
jgi:hypothetical protein